MKKKNKISKLASSIKKKTPAIVVAGVILAGLAGGAYYLSVSKDNELGKTDTNNETTTEAEVQDNIEKKGEVTGGTTTTTPSVVAETPLVASINDVSLSVLRDGEQADVLLYGPAGTYGVEKLVSGTWTVVNSKFTHTGRGSYLLDTITSAVATTHYRIFKLENDVRTATSGDTVISWQALLDNNGTLTVPLAR